LTNAFVICYYNNIDYKEFKPEIVEENFYKIQECISIVIKESEFRNKVKEDYNNIGINILIDKRSVMRKMSEKYPKELMGKVYSTIVGLG
jgi:hypothetical protein